MKNKTNYGIDAPGIIRNRIIAGIVFLIISIGVYIFFRDSISYLRIFITSIFVGLSICLLLTALLMILSSKIGKQKESDRIIEMLKVKGNEKVLDAGCGRGLYLIKIAQKLNTGKVTGIDIWSNDLSSNSKKSTLDNIKLENVTKKTEIKTGNLAVMPFKNNSFDIVISSFVINNILQFEKRKKALIEISRVLKEDGKLCIIDMRNIDEYVEILKKNNIQNITVTKTKYLYPKSKIIIGTKKTDGME
ncbi:MAG: class I SAM-dependent methyltransferase [Peptostreptococcaceae bacterium]